MPAEFSLFISKLSTTDFFVSSQHRHGVSHVKYYLVHVTDDDDGHDHANGAIEHGFVGFPRLV